MAPKKNSFVNNDGTVNLQAVISGVTAEINRLIDALATGNPERYEYVDATGKATMWDKVDTLNPLTSSKTGEVREVSRFYMNPELQGYLVKAFPTFTRESQTAGTVNFGSIGGNGFEPVIVDLGFVNEAGEPEPQQLIMLQKGALVIGKPINQNARQLAALQRLGFRRPVVTEIQPL